MAQPVNPYFQQLMDRIAQMGQAPSTSPNPDFLAQRAQRWQEHIGRVNNLRAQFGIPPGYHMPGDNAYFSQPQPRPQAPVPPPPVPQMPAPTSNANNALTSMASAPVPQIVTPKQVPVNKPPVPQVVGK